MRFRKALLTVVLSMASRAASPNHTGRRAEPARLLSPMKLLLRYLRLSHRPDGGALQRREIRCRDPHLQRKGCCAHRHHPFTADLAAPQGRFTGAQPNASSLSIIVGDKPRTWIAQCRQRHEGNAQSIRVEAGTAAVDLRR